MPEIWEETAISMGKKNYINQTIIESQGGRSDIDLSDGDTINPVRKTRP